MFQSLQLPLLITFLAALPFSGSLLAADPLAARTMIVYARNSPESVGVKDHYVAARSVTTVCPITLPDIAATVIVEPDYNTYVKTPVRNCLNAAGKAKILYIVLAYIRPYLVLANSGKTEFALDSYLADVWDLYATQPFDPIPTATHRYYADNQSQGNHYIPFQSLEAYRAGALNTLIYSVWRLDGATAAMAKGLVDKATASMNKLAGAVCIDRNRGNLAGVDDVSYGAGEWDLHRAGAFFTTAGFALTEDSNEAEYGAAPAPLKCPADGSPIAFYSGWYSLNHYNGPGVFHFAPGAIGVHLDSASALDPRGGPNWAANALKDGLTVTSGAVHEPYLNGLTRPGGLARNLLEGANVGDAFLRNTRWLKWMVINVGDPLYRPFPAAGKAPFSPPPAVNSLDIPMRDLVGGQTSLTGTIHLASAAGADGVNVTLSTTATVASVPPRVIVPAGSRTASFAITTSAVTGRTAVRIGGSFGSTSLANSITLLPLLADFRLSTSTISAGVPVLGAVFLNASAPAGGVTVSLTSSDTTVATVPPSVTIPAGMSRVNFDIPTTAAASSKTTNLTAVYAGSGTQAVLTAVPAFSKVLFNVPSVNSGQPGVLYVQFAVPAPAGGVKVTLTSSNNKVVPLNGPVQFPAGTRFGEVPFTAGRGPATVTVQASYGGDSQSATLTVR